ncbi:GTPase-activating protein gyp1 [Reticulomyxa filosa]|uniref:GTPase-activating protein gyp1 n=1 Tax=Reticulomyxa filosa TaxID=46433 RepID=X6MRN7_RETFI|nr:GTPase-activating protein gyp1 [Reticulomyxa filosa]|eukprot:ETO16464.1 GTPase-activating protein gyp1 [Reticulomyxa filosa]
MRGKKKKKESKFGVAIEDGQSMKLISSLKEEELLDVEADSYWCLDEFLESLQLNYTHEQPGIQRMMQKFQRLVEECDSSFINYTQSSPVQERKLAGHFKEQGVEFVQFSFRWMNCFLMREFTLQQIIYMWDTYLAEYHLNKDNVEQFHVFVCVALLLHFKKELIVECFNKDFADILLFIQDLPTRDWGEMQMSILMAEAQEKRLQWSMSARVSKKEVSTK